MIILPEICSLDDYEKMSNYMSISKDDPGTIISSHKVGIYDDFEKKIQYGILYYNGHGLRLVHEDGSSINTGYNKFEYCTVSDVNFKKLAVCVNDDSLFFSDKNDFETLLDYIDSLNLRTEYFLDAAIDRVSKVYLANYQNNIVSTALDKLIQEIPEAFFIEDVNYFIMVHYFTFRSDIVRKYVDFTRDETNDAFQILKSDREYSSIVSTIMDSINSKVSVIQSNIDLLDEYVYFYLYLSLDLF